MSGRTVRVFAAPPMGHHVYACVCLQRHLRVTVRTRACVCSATYGSPCVRVCVFVAPPTVTVCTRACVCSATYRHRVYACVCLQRHLPSPCVRVCVFAAPPTVTVCTRARVCSATYRHRVYACVCLQRHL